MLSNIITIYPLLIIGDLIMPASYAIGPYFEKLIKEKVESGRYSSASEVVREALRLFEDYEAARNFKLENLRRQLDEGRNSGSGKPVENVLERLEKKYSAKGM
jgi:antitoxin ParD1/3/4